jgi:cytochrome b pre-mRNA-processing protein 3|tara:strand:+ start:129 stop:593 length:465 start_codon:yes stop_codon:yes gene_type:complete
MNNYLSFYNNLVKLTRNKDLYKDFNENDEFSDRLIFFLIHLAFFFKIYKKKDNRETLQQIYDFTFKQLELSIREIGYGDQSINKKMKDYINTFHSMLDRFHFWEELDFDQKKNEISTFVQKSQNYSNLIEYFEKYLSLLKNNTLNSYLKSVINP